MVKRYISPKAILGDIDTPVKDGDFVLYTDYQKLEAEVERLRDANKSLIRDRERLHGHTFSKRNYTAMLSNIETLEKKLKASEDRVSELEGIIVENQLHDSSCSIGAYHPSGDPTIDNECDCSW